MICALQIRDDTQRPTGGIGPFESGGSVPLALESGGKTLDLSLASDGTISRQVGAKWQRFPTRARVVREADSTWHFVAIARNWLLSPAPFERNAVAFDEDWGVLKQ